MSLPTQHRAQSIVTQFRNYDQCVYNWLSKFPSQADGTPTPIVVATPDRAFSAMAVLLKKRGVPVSDDIKSIPLPFISITTGNLEFDPSRFHGPAARIPLGMSPDKRTAYSVKYPMPYNISYRVEFWAKNMETLNAFKYWAAVDFTPGHENFLTVDLSDVWPAWKNKIVPITNNGSRFVGDLEPAEGHRVLRQVAEFELKGWIIAPVNTAKTVHQIIVDTYLAKTNADLARAVGDQIDEDPDYDLVDHTVVQ